MKRDAIRIHTAAELYWGAIMGAVKDQNMPKFESYVKVYGWLATAGARLLQQLIAIEDKQPGTRALDVITSLKGGKNDTERRYEPYCRACRNYPGHIYLVSPIIHK